MSILARLRPGPLATLQSKREFVDKFPLPATIEVAEAFGESLEEVKTGLTQTQKLESVPHETSSADRL